MVKSVVHKTLVEKLYLDCKESNISHTICLCILYTGIKPIPIRFQKPITIRSLSVHSRLRFELPMVDWVTALSANRHKTLRLDYFLRMWRLS